ncbi:Glycoside hydrolase family 5 protein [Mycena kentingensis (nom. inval.)]|nr:Glycoside hydrolase family 5 protein [Mycena kentingensis (nom. inval.)]
MSAELWRLPAVEELPSEVQRDVQEHFNSRTSEFQDTLESLLEEKYIVDMPVRELWPYAARNGDVSFGTTLSLHIQWFIDSILRPYLNKFGDTGRLCFNKSVERHMITLSMSPYGRCASAVSTSIVNGVFHIHVHTRWFGTQHGPFGDMKEMLVRTIEPIADALRVFDGLLLRGFYSICVDYEGPRGPELCEKFGNLLGMEVKLQVPWTELDVGLKTLDPRDERRLSLGEDALFCFWSVYERLKKEVNEDGLEAVRSKYEKQLTKRTISVRISDWSHDDWLHGPSMKIENGVGYLDTTAEEWGSAAETRRVVGDRPNLILRHFHFPPRRRLSCRMPKTVVVLGAAYGGARAAQLIAAGLPDDWRILLIDRNSHVNHVYILPRLAVLPGHEHKAFIPCDNIFNVDAPNPAKHAFLRASVLSFTANTVTLSRAFPELGIPTATLEFDYAVYALGSHLPAPLNLWHASPDGKPCIVPYGGTKPEAISWLKRKQRVIDAAGAVLVVGGGALGIQFATDIKAIHPHKHVTLLHSRARLLPRFDVAMHLEILQELESLGVDVVLGERLDLTSVPTDKDQSRATVVRTLSGREISADLVLLCTGQTPNTELLSAFDENTVDPETRLAHVLRTMQLGLLPAASEVASPEPVDVPVPAPVPEPTTAEDSAALLEAALAQIALQEEEAAAAAAADDFDSDSDAEGFFTDESESEFSLDTETTPYPHIFVVGDAADAFGAIPAGHNAYYQAEVAAKNVLALIHSPEDADPELTRYVPGAPAIKVSLGMRKNVYQVNGVVGVGKESRDDLNAASIWGYFGCPMVLGEEEEDREEMHR